MMLMQIDAFALVKALEAEADKRKRVVETATDASVILGNYAASTLLFGLSSAIANAMQETLRGGDTEWSGHTSTSSQTGSPEPSATTTSEPLPPNSSTNGEQP